MQHRGHTPQLIRLWKKEPQRQLTVFLIGISHIQHILLSSSDLISCLCVQIYVADKLTQLNVNLPSLMCPSLTTVTKEKEFDESKMLMTFFCLFFLCIFFEFLCHQTVILMLKSTCELYRIIRKVLLLLGSTVDFCYVSASHPQPSSRCEILANAQPSRGPAGFTHDFQILKVARLRPSCLTSLAKREKSFDRVVLVSSQRNVDVTFVDDLLCHARGYSQNSGKKKKP